MSLSPNRRTLFGAVLALAALASLPLAAQERVSIAGTTVSLVPPKGFASATGFAGLQNTATKASVLVAELPVEAHAPLSSVFASVEAAAPSFAKQNVKVEDHAEIDTGAGKVPLLSGTQSMSGVTFDKWMVLLKGAKTVLVTVQSPVSAKLPDATVEAMIKSISLGAEPSVADKLAALPFAVAASEPFRIVDTIGGATVLMTAGPNNTDPSGQQPMLIVASQLSGGLGANVEQLSDALLKQTRGFADATVTRREKQRFAGADGFLLAGTDSTGKRFEQHLATGSDGRFVRLIVMAPAETFDGLKPAIDRVVGSVAFRPAK